MFFSIEIREYFLRLVFVCSLLYIFSFSFSFGILNVSVVVFIKYSNVGMKA
jgi:hypothetical protein